MLCTFLKDITHKIEQSFPSLGRYLELTLTLLCVYGQNVHTTNAHSPK